MKRNTQSEKKSVVQATVETDLYEQVVALATLRDWSLAKAGGHLIKLGLEKLSEQTNGANGALNRSARFYDQIS